MSTKISWCDETINPVVGCSKISAGCLNCYAEKMAGRLCAMGLPQYRQTVCYDGVDGHRYEWNGKTALVPSELEKPYRWKRPRSIFVCSMGDLFHESVETGWLNQIMQVICDTPQHTYLFLTKRAENALEYLKYTWMGGLPKNLIVGVTAENQEAADERIPILLQIPAAKRFVSIEPMIGPVDLLAVPVKTIAPYEQGNTWTRQGIHGVVLGGESGPKARPLDPAWVRSVRDQCEAASAPFMFKQWGRNVVPENERPWEYNDENGFPILDGRTHTELAWEVKI